MRKPRPRRIAGVTNLPPPVVAPLVQEPAKPQQDEPNFMVNEAMRVRQRTFERTPNLEDFQREVLGPVAERYMNEMVIGSSTSRLMDEMVERDFFASEQTNTRTVSESLEALGSAARAGAISADTLREAMESMAGLEGRESIINSVRMSTADLNRLRETMRERNNVVADATHSHRTPIPASPDPTFAGVRIIEDPNMPEGFTAEVRSSSPITQAAIGSFLRTALGRGPRRND